MARKLLARLKPYNKRRGHLLQRLHISGFGRLDASKGWYAVDEALADRLRACRQDENDPNSPEACDVVTEEEAREIDARESAANARAAANRPNEVQRQRSTRAGSDAGPRRRSDVMTTADLPRNARDEEEPAEDWDKFDPNAPREQAPEELIDGADAEDSEDPGADDEPGLAPVGLATPPQRATKAPPQRATKAPPKASGQGKKRTRKSQPPPDAA